MNQKIGLVQYVSKVAEDVKKDPELLIYLVGYFGLTASIVFISGFTVLKLQAESNFKGMFVFSGFMLVWFTLVLVTTVFRLMINFSIHKRTVKRENPKVVENLKYLLKHSFFVLGFSFVTMVFDFVYACLNGKRSVFSNSPEKLDYRSCKKFLLMYYVHSKGKTSLQTVFSDTKKCILDFNLHNYAIESRFTFVYFAFTAIGMAIIAFFIKMGVSDVYLKVFLWSGVGLFYCYYLHK